MVIIMDNERVYLKIGFMLGSIYINELFVYSHILLTSFEVQAIIAYSVL